MYLSLYYFDGDAQVLAAAHRRMIGDHYPVQTLLLHALLRTGTGVAILDACPSKEVHEAFAASAELRGALAGVGLPEPRIEALGDVEWLHVADSAVPA